ncbi:PSP1 domain-containing protein [Desulfurella sp.]|uniref:PSP1 domain-containing protein n=1 Tax=Desulfurella sp. TaxID=1962857 RepID=UPI003D110CB3
MSIAYVVFKHSNNIILFKYSKFDLNVGDFVIAESERGLNLGRVIKISHEKDDKLKSIVRVATQADYQKYNENLILAQKAKRYCAQEAKNLNLDIKLVDVEYTIDNSKIIFYFTSPTRVDFRHLVKKLASYFKTRIEMRQIGVRDEAKLIGGIGLCGQIVCCKRFLQNFEPVSIKMAKDQNLSISVKKISGICGRLLCCLYYEEHIYSDFLKNLPPKGSIVEIDEQEGELILANPIKNTIIIKDQDGKMIEVSANAIKNVIKIAEEKGEEYEIIEEE